jgi:37-kD nucleoid-associated bacterial protein
MINYINAAIDKVSVHGVGNKTNGDGLQLSKSLLDITGEPVRELLAKFFLTPFANPEFYHFSFSNEDFSLNPLYQFASGIFDDPEVFHKNSINIAKHLYELSIHPQIKAGDLFVAFFTDLRMDGEAMEAIGIFKSENRQSFLKLENSKDDFSIEYEDGINIEKLDKGCIIFNTDRDAGYKVSVIDKLNKSSEAQYWKDGFLQLKPCSDDFHHTKTFMDITKDFVTKQLTEEYDISRADQIDLLNRSVAYFKTHDTFDKDNFETEVFQDTGIIKSFRNFDESYRDHNGISINDQFDISAQAVKKQSRVFKSVLKLDKNFHIYIHGNRELIEQGIEKDGRKFYKIYFEQEA